MRYFSTSQFERDFKKLSPAVRLVFQKQIELLLNDIRHPSLHAKKYGGAKDVWQARVNQNIRLYFLIRGDVYILLNIRKHSD
ncbi:MAG: hypothetical protein A3B13_01145 [Candidatus Liptonbacteria bacterium RIFCSPLOWO2_01_FULL_45_15]|uniref:Addiction module toxin RelE n=1 Tax=Candidatus Liptonbacteria bacterium RIFCSPLOWO2_01_FULL_45_15 TaxID=1798649 RepID=A0A1G2CG12_9BACT|nr:MAG: hypothetical protein A3B13_01145 [Candidatus Liptonbacteria bacterium RIFCSPLOWO2_01_FULL_45_15]